MAEQKKGWVIPQYGPDGRYLFEKRRESANYKRATLVFTDEPVYTATEVRAMLADIGNHSIMFLSTGAFHRHIIETAKQHGVVFDEPDPDVMGMAVPKSDHAE